MNNSVKENSVKSVVVRYLKEIRATIAAEEFKSEDNDVCNDMACGNLTDAMQFTHTGDYEDAITLLNMAQEMIGVIEYSNDIDKAVLYEKIAYVHGFLAKLYTRTF